jgi:nitrite reductase (NADH) small subunit
LAAHVIGTLADLDSAGRIVAEINGRSIGVLRVDGALYALRNICTHQQGPLCEGAIFPAHKATANADGAVTEYLDHENPVICCPWHGWEYDIKTGVCLADPTRRVATYAVEVEGQDVVVTLPDP